MIPFNKPYLSGKETDYITNAVASGKISGNGKYTQKCQDFFEKIDSAVLILILKCLVYKMRVYTMPNSAMNFLFYI